MRPHTFHVLLSLAAEPRHGSAIAKAAREDSGGHVTLWPVTLYGTLAELEDEGLIEALDRGAHPPGESERRKYYRLTRTGRKALNAEVARLAAVVATATRRIRPREAT